MKILISTQSLDYSGVPTYTLTLFNELIFLGHEVLVYSPQTGPMAQAMNTTQSLNGFEPDVILAQSNRLVQRLKHKFPNTKILFLAHGVLPEFEQSPRLPINHYIAINEQVVDNLICQYVDPNQISIIRDFVDMEKFQSTSELQEDPRVLFISNYKKWRTYDIIKEATRELGMPFKAIGSPYGISKDTASEINQADIVISWGRGILEAMSCGRTAISFDKQLGDGYMTPQTYIISRERNFSGYECMHSFTVDTLIDELRKYKPEDGRWNREIIKDYHNSKIEVEKLINIINAL